MRPRLLRPPDFRSGSVSAGSGPRRVISAKSCPVWKRRPADVGRYWTMATALRSFEEVDPVAFGERDVRLLPVGPAAVVTADAADLAHAHLEQRLDRLADLDLVRPRVHPKHDLVAGLADERALLRDHGPLHD